MTEKIENTLPDMDLDMLNELKSITNEFKKELDNTNKEIDPMEHSAKWNMDEINKMDKNGLSTYIPKLFARMATKIQEVEKGKTDFDLGNLAGYLKAKGLHFLPEEEKLMIDIDLGRDQYLSNYLEKDDNEKFLKNLCNKILEKMEILFQK